MKIQNIQPVKQIQTEGFLLNHSIQIFVSSRNNTYINRENCITANWVNLFFLKHSKQFGLHAKRHFSDFVQKNSSCMSLLEQAFLSVFACTCKSTFAVTEQFRFQYVFGNGGTVNSNKRTVFSCACIMYALRKNFFSRSAFTCNQNGAVRLGIKSSLFNDLSGNRAFA
ncbi:hypothetical protein SDC9_181774 [bioreactor metagenome]|uniref:Uncharacterized protein n=1 Tax=bioreactor metagenome TaxID=1076179 RepID=A0A645H5H0_9ZZZZ